MSDVFLVHGPPGTGKTTYLARQARRAAAEHGAERVAIVSLTRAAAAEIGGRDTAIPLANVGTLHAACFRGLDRPRLAETPSGLRAFGDAIPELRVSGGRRRLDEASSEPDGIDAGGGRTRGDDLHGAVTAHRARRTPRERWSEEERSFERLWRDWKEQTGRLDFTDLVEQALAELPAHPSAPAVLLLDEAQDFSALELALARRWAAGAATTVICGDADQALYQWRGSDPATLLATPVTGTRALVRSHRVPRAVHRLADRWIRQLPDRAPVAYRPTAADGAVERLPISLRWVDPLLAAIEDDVASGRSVMVLTACGYLLAPVLHLLRQHGMPFHNPYRPGERRWNPLDGAAALAAFLRPSAAAWKCDARPWTWEDLRRWTEPLASRALGRGARELIAAKCATGRLAGARGGEEVPLPLLCELLGGGAGHPALAVDVEWWASQLRAAEAARQRYALRVLRAHGPRALCERPQVTVGTIHSVKGGEADVVYLFPDLSRQGMWHGWHAVGASRDQIVRMAYVAFTRARERVVLLDAAGPEHLPLDGLDGGER